MTRTLEPTSQFTQARVRVSRYGAELLEQLLVSEEMLLIAARDNTPHYDERVEIQRKVRAIRRIKEEVRRAAKDRGWT
jgi:hypothetical protein